MKLKFIKPSTLDRNLKATLQKSGKIGFTTEAAIKMELSTDKNLSIAENEDDEKDHNLYVIVNNPKADDAFQILKAGAYFYVNTKPLFKTLKWDYEKYNFAFEITEERIDDMKVFKFKTMKKERDKNEKEATD